jgi:ADP-ribosylglycohydrolase
MNTKPDHDLSTVATAGLLGLAVGDALGVPVEFYSRKRMQENPVTDMRGFGTHNQPSGTWSDDTSLTLCLAESLTECGLDYQDQAYRFIGWWRQANWTPHGEVFDIGNATRGAISRLELGVNPTDAGLTSEHSNGNGSVMRILPIAIYLAFSDPQCRMDAAMQCSRLTHGHPRCQIACALFVEIAAALVRDVDIHSAVGQSQALVLEMVKSRFPQERSNAQRLFNDRIGALDPTNISGSGYVVDCLEASIWCALSSSSYEEGVLKAVNLGDDTDTTGAVAGSLLGLRFGRDSIPHSWQEQLARRHDILALCERFQAVCEDQWKEKQ